MIIRWEILIDLLLAMFCCLIIIAVMRWVATPLVWLSILGVLVSLGAGKCCKRHEFSLKKNILLMSKCISGTYYSIKQYIYLKNRPPTDANIHTNLSLLVDTWFSKPNTWLYIGIAAAIVLIIIFLVVLVLRKRIVIAIALVKEGSKYVQCRIYF